MPTTPRDFWKPDPAALAAPWKIDADALLALPNHDAELRNRLLANVDRSWQVVASIVARAAAGDDEAARVAGDLLKAWPQIRRGEHEPSPEPPPTSKRHRVRL